jgi:ferredoxin-NADP reductase
MAGTAVLGRLTWQLGQVVELVRQTPRVSSLVLDVPGWPGHQAGQHLDVRLTAEDGYQAQRSYSIASAPGSRQLEMTVELIEEGEVSPYLVGEVMVGDRFELRGPIGGFFVWDPARATGPLMLIGAGSGVVPLMAMIRSRHESGSRVPTRLLYSSRSFDDIIFREELERLAAAGDGLEVRHTLTRAQPPGWTGYARRVDRDMLREFAWPAGNGVSVYACGPTSFVEVAAGTLVDLGHAPRSIKTERFGPTGG